MQDRFSTDRPSHQAALDLFAGGWGSRMPQGTGLVAGELPHFEDKRVPWAADALGGLAGLTILELGPYEAYNTAQFEQRGAASVLAIEAASSNFLKCLIVKNILGLRATFLLGDFMPYLADTQARFDLCWASGVLYHLTRPVAFLEQVARVAPRAFVWTHYWDEAVMATHPDRPIYPDAAMVRLPYHGRTLTLHGREYHGKATNGLFSGGGEDTSYWMELDDILHVLAVNGLPHVAMGRNNPAHGSGPACYFIASREPLPARG